MNAVFIDGPLIGVVMNVSSKHLVLTGCTIPPVKIFEFIVEEFDDRFPGLKYHCHLRTPDMSIGLFSSSTDYIKEKFNVR